MPAAYHHGIKIAEPVTGVRALTGVASNIIGLVATASDADALAFPLNKPVLVTDVRTAIGDAGVAGTLAKALGAIADQTSPIVVVVRVAPGVAAPPITAQEATDTNVIGGTTGGVYTGMQALLAAEAQLGVRPRILGCPGLDTQEVTTALAIVAKRLRGFVYASCPGADEISEAITYRGEFGDRELMLLYPDFTGWAGHAVAAALGLRAKIDEETGWHKTLSNVAVAGVTGLSRDIYFDLTDASTPAGLLNADQVTTLIRMNGYRFWGSRTCSDEPLFAFESAVRTAQVLQDTIAQGLVWAIDKPLTASLARDIIETINSTFRLYRGQGRLIGGEAWYDPAQNSASELSNGVMVIDYDYTPCAPLEQLGLNQRITDRWYLDFGDSLAAL